MMSELRYAFLKKLPLNWNYANALMTGYGLMGTTIIIQLVLVPMYLEHLGKEKFGILVMIMAANNYAAIGIGWLSGGMARILAEKAATDDVAGFCASYSFAKLLYVGYAIIALLIFWSISPILFISAYSDSEIFKAVLLSSFYFILVYEYNADRAAFNARHWQSKGNVREIIGQIFFALGVLWGLHANWGLPGVVTAQIFGILVTRLLAWHFWQNDHYRLRWSFKVSGFKDLLNRVSGKMGRDYIIYGILLLTLQADVLFLGWLAGPKTAATYYLLWRIPEVCILLLWRIPGSYSPFLIAMDARGEKKALSINYRRGLLLITGLAGAAALIYAIFGSWILEIWVGEDAPTGVLPYVFAASAMFFFAIARWPAGIAYSLVNTSPLIYISLLELITKFILIILLFSTFDYYTPMLATTCIHALLIFYLYLWLGQDTLSKSNITNTC